MRFRAVAPASVYPTLPVAGDRLGSATVVSAERDGDRVQLVLEAEVTPRQRVLCQQITEKLPVTSAAAVWVREPRTS